MTRLHAILFIVAVVCSVAEVYADGVNLCGTTHCPAHQICILEEMFCKRAPCPPHAQCVDKTEYICFIHRPCLNGGSCGNTREGGFVCTCQTGFTGVSCEQTFIG